MKQNRRFLFSLSLLPVCRCTWSWAWTHMHTHSFCPFSSKNSSPTQVQAWWKQQSLIQSKGRIDSGVEKEKRVKRRGELAGREKYGDMPSVDPPRVKAFNQMPRENEPVWHSEKIRCMGTVAPGWGRVDWEVSLLVILVLMQVHTSPVDRRASARVTCWKTVIAAHKAVSNT